MNKIQTTVKKRLKALSVTPNEAIGQHFLIDETALNILLSAVQPNSDVIEIGSGVGHLTEALSKRAHSVVAIEIDQHYAPVLASIPSKSTNVSVVLQNVLGVDFKKFIFKSKDRGHELQIIANLPFHIIEPFLHKIVNLPIMNAVLVTGKNFMRTIQAKPRDRNFGQTTLLVESFFDYQILSEVNKKGFFPVPRTDSIIVQLSPKPKEFIRINLKSFLIRRLFLTAKYGSKLKNSLKDGFIEFYEENKFGLLSQNQARLLVESLNVSDVILNKSFQQLNNQELNSLSEALKRIDLPTYFKR